MLKQQNKDLPVHSRSVLYTKFNYSLLIRFCRKIDGSMFFWCLYQLPSNMMDTFYFSGWQELNLFEWMKLVEIDVFATLNLYVVCSLYHDSFPNLIFHVCIMGWHCFCIYICNRHCILLVLSSLFCCMCNYNLMKRLLWPAKKIEPTN